MQVTRLSRLGLPPELATARVKNYCRVFDSEHDQTIDLMVDAAIEFIQTYTRQVFRSSVYEQLTDDASMPIVIARMPLISLDKFEWQSSGGIWTDKPVSAFGIDHSIQPTKLTGTVIDLATQYRLTYTAGWSEWPADLILLVLQMVSESFDRRGATPANAQAAIFSNAFKLSLEQYCTHHDAVIWA